MSVSETFGCPASLTAAPFRTPDTAPVKQKMLYASTKESFKRQLVGISGEVQATDASEVDYDYICSNFK